MKEGGETVDSVKKELFGKTVEIQHPRLINILREIELIEKGMAKEMENELTKKTEDANEGFTSIFNKYDDALKICQTNVKMEGISENLQNLWKSIDRYFQASKHLKTLERNRILVHGLIDKFVTQKQFDNIFLQKQDYKLTKPQDIVKMCDLTLQVTGALKEIAMDMNSKSEREDLLERYYQYLRGFFVSCYHISQGNYLNGISLFCAMKKSSEYLLSDMKSLKDQTVVSKT